jgi:hypothetical protein
MYVPAPIVTAQPADAARREFLYAELSQVEARLTALQRERKGIGGPITQMIIGYGATLIFSSVALGCFGSAQDIKHHHYYRSDGRDLDFNDSGVVNHKDELALRRTAYAFTGLASVGLLLGVSGTLRLARNVAQRKSIKVERKGLLDRRAELRRQLDYGASVAPGQFQLGVQGRF